MKNGPVRKSLPIVCCLAGGLFTSQVLADWSDKEPYGGYNPGYGDFPPTDIDQKLSGIDDTGKAVEVNTPQANNAPAANNRNQPVTNPAAANPTPNASAQGYAAQPQQQAYGNYYQNPNYSQPGYQQPGYAQPSMQRYNRGSSVSGPWNNNRSSFSGPWNNRGSGFSGPWNNRGSGFSGPWNNNNNRGPSFSGPWNNNGSSFSGPWNNNGSSFSPFGNGGGWGW